MRSPAIVMTLGLCWLGLGCVSQGTYDDLKKQHDEAQGKLSVAEATLVTLEQSRDEWQQKATALSAELEKTKQALHALETERDTLNERITELDGQVITQREALAQLIKDKSRLRETTRQLQDALTELAKRKAEAEARVAEARGLLARFKPLIDAGQLRVTIVDGRMVLSLPADVLFDTGSARLSKVGKQAITEVAIVLREDFPDRRFQVEGHTDNVPIHNEQYVSNWELAAGRALGVVKLMIEQGMKPEHVSASSYGEYRPAQSNDTDAGRAYNRRIEIILVPDLTSLPGFEELKSAVEQS